MKFLPFAAHPRLRNASLVFLGLMITFTPQIVQAETEKELLVSLEFPPGPNRQPPRSTQGAGVRGKVCVVKQETKPLTALMSNRDNQTKTIAAQPTFFVYVPENNAKTGEFVIRDEQGKPIAVEQIPINSKSGIFKFSIPESISLEVNQKYQWEFSLECGNIPDGDTKEIKGEIQRVELSPSAKEELANAIEPLKQAQIYASNEIWQETLTLMATQRCNQEREWEELLKSVGLGAFTEDPFVN